MSNVDKFWLGINTTVISMGIVFIVLIILSYMLVIQSKILNILSKKGEEDARDRIETVQPTPSMAGAYVPQNIKTGLTQGQASLMGVEDEELAAVIMAAVSEASSIPLTSLRIKSIKSLDENWANVAKQEQMR